MTVEERSFRESTTTPIDVFVSYASDARITVERLADCLEAQGWTVWWDRESAPGKTWAETLKQARERARCIVVVWSRRSAESEWVRAEATEAKRRKILIPAMIDTVPPLEFHHMHTADLSRWSGDRDDPAIWQLVAGIEGLLSTGVKASEKSKPGEPQQESQAAPEKAQAGQGESPTFRWRTWIGRGVRIVAFATGLVTLLLGAWAMTRLGLDELNASAMVTHNSALCEAVPGFGPEMILVEGGPFQLEADAGSTSTAQQPAHTVTVKPFAIGTCEVTFEDYDRFAEATKRSLPDDEGWGRGRRPVINVSWDDAKAYAAWLSQQTGKAYRLPTEAEWEYAARSGGRNEIWAGTSDEKRLSDYAVYGGNVSRGTSAVGSKMPNGFGLSDMSGNVWEWVEDCYGGPTKESACGRRVIRGGSWSNEPVGLRASSRSGSDAGYRGSDIGFRLAQDNSE